MCYYLSLHKYKHIVGDRVIEQTHYIRIVLSMSQDIKYLQEHLHQYEKVLRNNFGDTSYKEVDFRIHRLKSSVDEIKNDLKKGGVI